MIVLDALLIQMLKERGVEKAEILEELLDAVGLAKAHEAVDEDAWIVVFEFQRELLLFHIVFDQMRATPDLRAASATAFATAGPTLGSNAFGMM